MSLIEEIVLKEESLKSFAAFSVHARASKYLFDERKVLRAYSTKVIFFFFHFFVRSRICNICCVCVCKVYITRCLMYNLFCKRESPAQEFAHVQTSDFFRNLSVCILWAACRILRDNNKCSSCVCGRVGGCVIFGILVAMCVCVCSVRLNPSIG